MACSEVIFATGTGRLSFAGGLDGLFDSTRSLLKAFESGFHELEFHFQTLNLVDFLAYLRDTGGKHIKLLHREFYAIVII